MKMLPYVEYEFDLSGTFSFGAIPGHVLLTAFGNGRQSGVLLEYDVAERFSNLTKDGCGQGSGEDLRILRAMPDKDFATVQCKSVRTNKRHYIGWTTKSGLWDTKRGKKKPANDWDAEHNGYFGKYDFFMYIDICDFTPVYRALLIPTGELLDHPDIIQQQQHHHFGKSGRAKTYCDPPNCWRYPVQVTREMYNNWISKRVKVHV